MSAVPKPQKASPDARKADLRAKAIARQAKWRAKAIQRSKGKPRPKLKERNEKRIARKAAAYRKVIASDFHRWLRYEAYMRSGGLCECDDCRQIRRTGGGLGAGRALSEIPVWFTKGGSAPHKRFRSSEGELHHMNYKFYGEENPEELRHVRWCWKECHRAIEALHGTRRRYLKGR